MDLEGGTQNLGIRGRGSKGGGFKARSKESGAARTSTATWPQTYHRLICLHNSDSTRPMGTVTVR